MDFLDAGLGQIAVRSLEDDHYDICKCQVLNSVVVVATWLHCATLDKLVDGRVGSCCLRWLTFFGCSNLIRVAQLLAVLVVFCKDIIFVDMLG